MVPLSLIFLVLLPFFFYQSSIFVKGDNPLIQKTCKTTEYPDLCVSALESNPVSQTADVKGLAVVVINVANADATDTSSFILDRLLKNATDPKLNSVLQRCSEKYKTASEALQGSVKDLGFDDYDSAALQVSAAADYPNSCHNVFLGTPRLTYPSELAQREVVLEHLCVVANGIIDLLG